MRKLTEKQESDICTQYIGGVPSPALAKIYGVASVTIQRILERHGIDRRDHITCQEIYTYDRHYFDNLDSREKAYWLGFIAADGCVSRNNTLSINLAQKDGEHLERFKKALSSDHPIYEWQRGERKYHKVTLVSRKLCAALEPYGIRRAKTSTVPWPSIPRYLLRHYLRGCFDGDGGFYFRKDCMSFSIASSSKDFILSCQQYLMQECDLDLTNLVFHKNKMRTMSLRYGGNSQVIRISNLMYCDASIFLPRKRDIFLNYMRSNPSVRHASDISFG